LNSTSTTPSAVWTTRHAQFRPRFAGKERDTESGNDYFGARYYASTMGRFMSPDWATTPVNIPYANLANPQSLNLYAYAANNPLGRADDNGHCSAPAVAGGHVGICLESYIQMARFGFGNLGHGDNRGPVANDPSATFRTQTMIDVNLGSQSATEHSTPGLSVTDIRSKMGAVHDWISDQQKGSDGSTTFTVHVYGENGEEAANNPLAPGGWIEMIFTLNVTADGKVKVIKESSKDFPSISVYSYQSNGGISSVFQQKESGNIDDLNKPAHSHMSPQMREGADWVCSFGNPSACGRSKEQ
jgi:RHS repeat-associated protein